MECYYLYKECEDCEREIFYFPGNLLAYFNSQAPLNRDSLVYDPTRLQKIGFEFGKGLLDRLRKSDWDIFCFEISDGNIKLFRDMCFEEGYDEKDVRRVANNLVSLGRFNLGHYFDEEEDLDDKEEIF